MVMAPSKSLPNSEVKPNPKRKASKSANDKLRQLDAQTAQSSNTSSDKPPRRVYDISPIAQRAKEEFTRSNISQLGAQCGQTTLPKPYYQTEQTTLFHGDAATVMARMSGSLRFSIDAIVTSPPYYGQRDYNVDGQIGLESHPQMYLERLTTTFLHAYDLLKPQGSLWVVLGDTYWSGKGKPKGDDSKQKHRRFDRPQDKTGVGPWCVPKQQLLIPHRFAIAMQELGWIVRNDNVWAKVDPMPDPVDDRCSMAHEYVFHFVKQRNYHFDMNAVMLRIEDGKPAKAPSSVWRLSTSRTRKQHSAVFPQEVVKTPILATCPDRGIILDPFCGSGTTLVAARTLRPQCRVIGIDISEDSLTEAQSFLKPTGG